MKVSEKKNNRWIYFVLVFLLVTFLGFSTLPLINSIVQVNQSVNETLSPSNISKDTLAQLESQAQGYQLVLEREPENQTALRGLLDIKLQLGDIEGTIIPLENLARLNPSQTDYMILLAQTKEHIGDYFGAKDAYSNILASYPGNMIAWQGLVNLLIEDNQAEEAIKMVQNALQSSTEDITDKTSLELLLAQIYATTQRYSEAITVYDQMIEAHQDDFRPLLSKAVVLQKQGKYIEAKPLFEKAISLSPDIYKPAIEKMAAQINTEENKNNTENLLTNTEDNR